MLTQVLASLADGFIKTLEIFFLTLAGALPLGLLIAFGSMSRLRPLRAVVKFIVWIVRGTPLMLQLIVIYYGPGLFLGNNIWGTGTPGRFVAVLAAFIFNYACYFSEIYRGGIESIPAGQYEAGQVLGLTRRQIFFKIVLLQVKTDNPADEQRGHHARQGYVSRASDIGLRADMGGRGIYKIKRNTLAAAYDRSFLPCIFRTAYTALRQDRKKAVLFPFVRCKNGYT